MIVPYHDSKISVVDDTKIISKGSSGHGYDVTLSGDIKLYVPGRSVIIDPKHPDPNSFDEQHFDISEPGEHPFILPGNASILALTVETFKMPANVIGLCMGKSTYARCMVLCNTTPLEAGWTGRLVVEITNMIPDPVILYMGEGIAQIVFLIGATARTPYAVTGKYQNQYTVQQGKV